jgi:hypothetical protein
MEGHAGLDPAALKEVAQKQKSLRCDLDFAIVKLRELELGITYAPRASLTAMQRGR